MTDRRTLLGAAAAALASSWTTARADIRSPLAATEHWVPGGTRGIQRGQYTYTPTADNEGIGIIPLPDAVNLFMIPLTKTVFDESGGGKFQLQGDGLVTVMKDDLYDLTANMDWPAQARGSGQDGYDTNMRKFQIKRVPVGVAPPPYTPGEVTRIPTNAKSYDGVAMHDTPGSSVPNTVRAQVPWTPGSVPAGGMVHLDVVLPAGSFTPSVGDLVRVSHTGLTDAALGDRNVGMFLSARIVAPRLARVVIENRYNAMAVAIPAGTLNVLAESAVTTAGNNGDSWTYLGSGPVYLLAGEKLMVAVRTSSPGDFLQITHASFLRIANVVA